MRKRLGAPTTDDMPMIRPDRCFHDRYLPHHVPCEVVTPHLRECRREGSTQRPKRLVVEHDVNVTKFLADHVGNHGARFDDERQRRAAIIARPPALISRATWRNGTPAGAAATTWRSLRANTFGRPPRCRWSVPVINTTWSRPCLAIICLLCWVPWACAKDHRSHASAA